MSIGILVKVHDGVVLAADSASTVSMMAQQPNQPPVVANVYNNANKIANLYKGLPIGCVAYGAGSIGSASMSTLLKDFRKRLANQDEQFGVGNYTMQDISKRLADFLSGQISHLESSAPKPTLALMISGYSANRSLPEAWLLAVDGGAIRPPQLLRPEEDVGINWGGEGEPISRLILGFSQELPNLLSHAIKPTPSRADMDQLETLFRNTLQVPLVLAPMPIQDAIDVAEWLVHTASMFSRFRLGPPTVGGPIESAAITKHEGFKWTRRKHYYERKYNPEVSDHGYGQPELGSTASAD